MNGTSNNLNNNLNTTQNFDYSQWQRKQTRFSLTDASPRFKERVTLNSPLKNDKASQLSSRKVTQPNLVEWLPKSPSQLRKECSSRCRHGKQAPLPEINKTEKRRVKDTITNLLKVQIKEKKTSLQQCKEHYLKLIRDNLNLKADIDAHEKDTHLNAKSLLLMHEKYRSGLSVMKKQHESEFIDAESDLLQTEDQIDTALNVLRDEVESLQGKICEHELALKVLLNYKEKEYPDKVEKIKQLKQDIELLEKECKNDFFELVKIADIEKTAFKSDADVLQEQIKTESASIALDSLDAETKTLAQRNILLKKEIHYHKEELFKHEKEIKCLQQDIRNLKGEEKKRIAERKHPELFMRTCSPDLEFELDIPTQKLLPI